jgi:hypothetical protein
VTGRIRGKSAKRAQIDPSLAGSAGAKRVAGDSSLTNTAGSKRVYIVPSHASDERVCWHFGAIDLEGPYGWRAITQEQLEKLIGVVGDIEKQTATELFDKAQNRQAVGGTKTIPVENLCKEAQKRLAALRFDDHNHLMELRVTRTARLWFLRFNAVACLLWWDPHHQVCPGNQ